MLHLGDKRIYLKEPLIIQAIKSPVRPGNRLNVCMTNNG